VSYLAIELKGEIPAEFQESMGVLVAGCDICQKVCPWTVKFSQALAADSPFRARAFVAGKDAVTLPTDILAVDQEQFSAAFRKSPTKRATLAGLRRNATVALASAFTPATHLQYRSCFYCGVSLPYRVVWGEQAATTRRSSDR
jgi:epoxyqueuosine reductase